MATYAHIETGCVLDAQPGDTIEDYLERFKGLDTSEWKVVEVHDSLRGHPNGLAIDDKGEIAFPAIEPEPEPKPKPTTQKADLLKRMSDLIAAVQALPDK